MDNTWANLSQSAKDFVNIVWPQIKQLGWLEGELIPVEVTSTTEWAKQLDVLAGIDAWLVKDGAGMSGIASRVQWQPDEHRSNYPYNTFNIRWQLPSGAKTEYHKRLAAILSDGELLYPYWTCHAYLINPNSGPLLSVALARTQDIIEIFSLGCGYLRTNPGDGHIFKCLPWSLMADLGYLVKTHSIQEQFQLIYKEA